MENLTNEISVSEAAELLGTSPRQVARRIQRGEFVQVYKLPGIRGPYVLNRHEVESKAGH